MSLLLRPQALAAAVAASAVAVPAFRAPVILVRLVKNRFGGGNESFQFAVDFLTTFPDRSGDFLNRVTIRMDELVCQLLIGT